MTNISLLDGTARRIAGVCSLIGGAFAVFWLIQILRGQVPKSNATNVELFIINSSVVALAFGLVAGHREVRNRKTFALLSFPFLSASWAARFLFKLNDRVEPRFGAAGFVTFVVAVGLFAAGVFVHERQRRVDAKAGVEADRPS